jgi:ABC-type microcin C transport system permease subunit YejE
MVHDLADFLGMGLPQGTPDYGKVLAEDKDLDRKSVV